MSKAQDLEIAINALIEQHVVDYQLTDADVMGALRVVACREEGAFGLRMVQAMLKNSIKEG